MLRWFISYLFVLPVLCLDVKNVTLGHPTTPESTYFINLDSPITCKFQPNGFDCDGNGLEPKFYYDIKLENCKSATVGSCPFNLNIFDTLSECHSNCRDVGTQPVTESLMPRIFCRLQHDFGLCQGYNPRWYFDVTTRRCKGFSYSGCGGNLNRFDNQQACVTACSGATDFKSSLN